MPNALQQGNTPPDPPDISNQENGLRAPVQSASPMNALSGQKPQVPVPSHDQTVTALRHFNAVLRELRILLENPDVGKADLKPKIIEGMTKLVGDRFFSPAQAVMQLATVPSDPLKQKKWLTDNFIQTIQAEDAILDHHRAGTPPDFLPSAPSGEPPDHLDTMDAIMQMYKPNG